MVILRRTLTIGLLAAGMAHNVAATDTPVGDSPQSQWQSGPTLPTAVQEIYPTRWQDSVVVAGGLAGAANGPLQISKKVWQSTADGWQPLADFPVPRHHPMMVPRNGALYAIGGFIETERGQWTNTSDVMQLTDSGWQSRTAIPVTLSETVAAVIDGEIHLAGGRTASDAANGRWPDSKDTDWHGIYSPDTDSWRVAPALPKARNSACSVVVNGLWHVIGGRTVDGGNSDQHDIYDADKKQWRIAPALPDAQGGLACAALRGTIYVFGGEFFDNGGGVYDTVWAFDTKANTWQAVSRMPLPRHGLGAVAVDDNIWVIGGAAQAGAKQTTDRIAIFSPDGVKRDSQGTVH